KTLKGVTVGQIMKPLSSIGIYTPGGVHGYPSSLLMCAIPAKIAGIKKIIVCTPPKKGGKVNPATLIAADLAGVTDVFRVGGVQAIAAMAYGTETIPKVDKIVGPGNIYVATAKQEVSKDVAIDLPAGPSEIVIIADDTAKPSFIASDILAQAEHGPNSLVILLTTSKDLSGRVNEEIEKQRKLLSRREIISSSIQSNGYTVVVKDIEEAIENANLIAPEHLHIQLKSPRRTVNLVQNAGAIFLGHYSPVAFGDYSAGLNHVLPTGGYSKTYSGLSINDFVKRINFLECNRNGFLQLRDLTLALAEIEGFDGHARSVSIRD
ncbi:MAG: histidinol dehydrogenase, partial [Candidatus Bathyarchaeota archaeon]